MDHGADYSDYSISHLNMFQPDFMPEPDFETLICTIQDETADNPVENIYLDYEINHFTGSCSQLLYNDHNDAILGASTDIGGYGVMDPNSDIIWNHEMEDVKVSDVFGDDDSSETATIGKPPKGRSGGGAKGDRTRTLISERKRRSGMKEKLYALRSLVPNITKMDKASIVGDAARYIQDLQAQARDLRSEIATIEATKNPKMAFKDSKKHRASNPFLISKKISKLDVFQVE